MADAGVALILRTSESLFCCASCDLIEVLHAHRIIESILGLRRPALVDMIEISKSAKKYNITASEDQIDSAANIEHSMFFISTYVI